MSWPQQVFHCLPEFPTSWISPPKQAEHSRGRNPSCGDLWLCDHILPSGSNGIQWHINSPSKRVKRCFRSSIWVETAKVSAVCISHYPSKVCSSFQSCPILLSLVQPSADFLFAHTSIGPLPLLGLYSTCPSQRLLIAHRLRGKCHLACKLWTGCC